MGSDLAGVTGSHRGKVCAISGSSACLVFWIRLLFADHRLGVLFIVWFTFYSNTQERKPVTNSRDTQELLPDAGQEMLRIFHTHPSRTTLLQDFAYYEVCF